MAQNYQINIRNTYYIEIPVSEAKVIFGDLKSYNYHLIENLGY